MQNNHHEENITAKMKGLRGKVSDLEKAAAQRKAKLDENSAFLQFNWKADVVESWIGTSWSMEHSQGHQNALSGQKTSDGFSLAVWPKPKAINSAVPDRCFGSNLSENRGNG